MKNYNRAGAEFDKLTGYAGLHIEEHMLKLVRLRYHIMIICIRAYQQIYHPNLHTFGRQLMLRSVRMH